MEEIDPTRSGADEEMCVVGVEENVAGDCELLGTAGVEGGEGGDVHLCDGPERGVDLGDVGF